MIIACFFDGDKRRIPNLSLNEDILVVSKHALPLVLSIREWKKKSVIKAIEIFGGHRIRQETSRLLTVVRQKSREKLLLPHENNWDDLLFELTSLLLEEESASSLILGDNLHWNEEQIVNIWNLAKEADILVSDLEIARQVLNRDKVMKIAESCNLNIQLTLNALSRDESRQMLRTGRLIACTSQCFQEHDKLELHASQLSEDPSGFGSKAKTNPEIVDFELIDIHEDTERFFRIHALSDGSTHHLLGITENVYKMRSSEMLKQNALSWIPKTAIAFDSSYLQNILSNEDFCESLYRFCDRIGLRGLFSVEFVLKNLEMPSSLNSEKLIFHGVTSRIMEETWLLEQYYKRNLIRLHVECLSGCSSIELKANNNRCFAFINLYAMNPFHFQIEEWKGVNFFERPVDKVTIPRGIHWGTVVLEERSVNNIKQKMAPFMRFLSSR